MKNMIEMRDLRRTYGTTEVVAGLSLDIREEEFLGILGTSGAGKTTLLNLIAGLDTPTSGTIRIDGACANDPRILIPPHRRDIGMLFQFLALWPHMTVRRHLEFVMNARRIPRSERPAKIARILALLHLEPHAEKRPAALSGGEAQRLALARALAGECRILLLDEPLSNLDTPLRAEMLSLIHDIHHAEKMTTLHVTHTPDEAFRFADRVAVLDGGALLQIGDAESLYRRPVDARAALLTGPGVILTGTVAQGAAATAVGRVSCAASVADGTKVDLLIRPDDAEMADDGPFDGIVRESTLNGGEWMNLIACGDASIKIPVRSARAIGVGTSVRFRFRRQLWGMSAQNNLQ